MESIYAILWICHKSKQQAHSPIRSIWSSRVIPRDTTSLAINWSIQLGLRQSWQKGHVPHVRDTRIYWKPNQNTYRWMSSIMDLYNCPKFDHCSAPICPLDPEWERRSHLNGERVCFYLTEYAKQAARPILKGCLAAEHYEAIEFAVPKIIDRHPLIKRQLSRSSKNPPRSKHAVEEGV